MDLLTTKFSLGKSFKSPNSAQVHFFSSASTREFEKFLQCYGSKKPSLPNASAANLAPFSIGLFDSGMGGLGIVQALEPLFPNAEIFYFADQAHFPYGEKSPSQILEYSRSCAHFLLRKGIQLLIIGCHTASAYALDALQNELPIPILGMIEPTLLLLQRRKKVVFLGSKALVHSSIYQSRIRQEIPEITIISITCQELISMVEEMRTEEIRACMQGLLPKESFDTLLLSCTHFTLIKDLFQEMVGPHVLVLDSAEIVAMEVSNKILTQTIS